MHEVEHDVVAPIAGWEVVSRCHGVPMFNRDRLVCAECGRNNGAVLAWMVMVECLGDTAHGEHVHQHEAVPMVALGVNHWN